MGSNSKRLTASQVSSLEGLFAKRLNICNPTECNQWLRKRLIEEYPLQPIFKLDEDGDMVNSITKKFTSVLYQKECMVVSSSKYIAVVVRIPWQQQTGPSCGISALNMLNGALPNIKEKQQKVDVRRCSVCSIEKQIVESDLNNHLTPLTFAIRSGVSNDGELFCSYNLAYVAGRALDLKLVVNELSESKIIMNELLTNHPVLIPYDRDVRDNCPAMVEGGQAHWAVIIGFITQLKNDNEIQKNETSRKLELPGIEDAQLYVLDAADCQNTDDVLFDLKEDEVFLICMHGMSPKPFVCSFQEMHQSNGQLYKSKSKFYMASEDLMHLRGKIVLVEHE